MKIDRFMSDSCLHRKLEVKEFQELENVLWVTICKLIQLLKSIFMCAYEYEITEFCYVSKQYFVNINSA